MTESTASTRVTITALADVGAAVNSGSVLYRVDEEPVVAIVGDSALTRDLEAGVDDDEDVAMLESALVTMGFADFVVDAHYDDDTAAAVEDWELSVGRAEPDGVVTVGEVEVLDLEGFVLERAVAIGDRIDVGTTVLTLASQGEVVAAEVDAGERSEWAAGTSVRVTWGDASTARAVIIEVGRDASDGVVTITAVLVDGPSGRSVGTAAILGRLADERRDVVAIPVSAVIDVAGKPVVRVVAADGSTANVDVTLGLRADTWIEVLGLDVGTSVQVPG